MTCGLHGKLDAAVAAVKEALTVALDGDFAEKDLEDILAAYTNLKSVSKRTQHEPQITFTPDPTLGGAVEFNDNISINTDDFGAAEPVTIGSGILGGAGSDVITFGNDITFTDSIDKDD
tara:strand:- start:43 stop:399 length:357 start_codon:yes stop_codon:yes gene_type:complete